MSNKEYAEYKGCEKILIVIDMMKDFINENGKLYIGETGKQIVPPIFDRVLTYRKEEVNVPIIYVCDNHDENDAEFKRFPAHCVKGTTGAEVIDCIRPQEDEIVINKNRYSGFYGTQLDFWLEKLKPKTIEIVGCCTDICVLHTVEELCNRDMNVIVYKNEVATFNQNAHAFALSHMEKVLGAKIS